MADVNGHDEIWLPLLTPLIGIPHPDLRFIHVHAIIRVIFSADQQPRRIHSQHLVFKYSLYIYSIQYMRKEDKHL
jgi:hypothetical protein